MPSTGLGGWAADGDGLLRRRRSGPGTGAGSGPPWPARGPAWPDRGPGWGAGPRGGHGGLEPLDDLLEPLHQPLHGDVHVVEGAAQVVAGGGDPLLDAGLGVGEALHELLPLDLDLLEAEHPGSDDHIGGIFGHGGDVLGRLGDVGVELGDLRHLDVGLLDGGHGVLLQLGMATALHWRYPSHGCWDVPTATDFDRCKCIRSDKQLQALEDALRASGDPYFVTRAYTCGDLRPDSL